MKRSEFVKLVNDIVDDEMDYLHNEVDAQKSTSTVEELGNLLSLLYVELPAMSARIAATIIEKSDLIHFDPE